VKADPEFREERRFLKSPINIPADLMASDEDRRVKAPPVQKPYPGDARLVDLAAVEELSIGQAPFVKSSGIGEVGERTRTRH
jgi:hypothetical protein